jgi:hypothetical protein
MIYKHSFSKLDIEKLFPYATLKEALGGLKVRHRHTINREMLKGEEDVVTTKREALMRFLQKRNW